jgi:hypothetical protein
MTTYALGDAMSFVPRYPWNDDERDTKTFIQYCSTCIQEEEEYIPTFVILKDLYREQQQDLCHDDWWYCSSDYDYSESSEDDDSTSQSFASIDCTTDVEEESVKTPKNEVGCEDGEASSPYVSNKFWYM